MARKPAPVAQIKQKTLAAAAEMFLEIGYTKSTTRGIARHAGVEVSAMNRTFGSKENILCHLVSYVLEEQFRSILSRMQGESDPVLYYAAETTMQLYMAESSECVRELYLTAYSLPASAQLIQTTISDKLRGMFSAHLPENSAQDFYELELASFGIIRSFMSKPCDAAFTMERKVRRFLECALRIYQAPEQKIEQAIAYVNTFNFPAIADEVIQHMLQQVRSTTL